MKRWSMGVFAISLAVAGAGAAGRARAEGSTLTSVKTGACALLTASDAGRVWNVPMHVELGVPGRAPPGRMCVYRPVKPDGGRRAVQLRLLDAGEWSELATGVFGKVGTASVSGIGDEAYVLSVKRASRASALVLYARRGHSQFAVRVAGTGAQLTEALKQVARGVAGRL